MTDYRCVTPIEAGYRHLICEVIAFALLSFSTATYAEQRYSPGNRNPLPTFDKLPHAPLPSGFFEAWCGPQGRILMKVDRRIEVYDKGMKSSTITDLLPAALGCDNGGKYIRLVDDRSAQVSEVDISTSEARRLATFETRNGRFPRIAFSPDSRKVASDTVLKFSKDAGDIAVIQLAQPERRTVDHIRWKDDSSILFDIVSVNSKKFAQFVEIRSLAGEVIGSGGLPAGTIFRDGWFSDDGQQLILFLGLLPEEAGDGVIVKCSIKKWRCGRLVSNVAEASSGSGIFGLVLSLGRKPGETSDQDYQILPPRYVVEVRSAALTTLVREEFRSISRPQMKISIAPSGAEAVLTWASSSSARCRRDSGFSLCEAGVVVDLGEFK